MSDDAHERSELPADDLRAEATGPSVGEAKWAVMKELEPRFPGITADCVEFQVLADGDDGPAHVVGQVDDGAWEEVATTMPADPAERLRDLVTRVIHALGLKATVDVFETPDELRANVDGDDLGLLIGKHGATIDALQHLAVRIVLRDGVRDKQVVIDAAGYRGRREEALQRAADRAVSEALEYGRAVELEPMRALERKVVHNYLSGRTDVTTHSEGDEPERRLVVTPASPTAS
jgi:spoIIIJ-associated protein